jgi:hypothetical protein
LEEVACLIDANDGRPVAVARPAISDLHSILSYIDGVALDFVTSL